MKKIGSITAIAIVCMSLLAIVCLGMWHLTSKKTAEQLARTIPIKSTEIDPGESGKYLVIKEWDVRFKLPAELQGDVYYTYSNDPIEHIWLRSRQLDRIVAQCPNKDFYLYSGLSRSKTRYTVDTYPLIVDTLAFKQIGEYWYDISGATNEAALTQSCPDNTAVSNQKDAFNASFGGAQAIADSLVSLQAIN